MTYLKFSIHILAHQGRVHPEQVLALAQVLVHDHRLKGNVAGGNLNQGRGQGQGRPTKRNLQQRKPRFAFLSF